MTLSAVDEGGQTAPVQVYNFTVVNPPQFELARGTKRMQYGDTFTDPAPVNGVDPIYAVGDTYLISPLEILDTTNFSTADGSLNSLRYALNGTVLPAGLFVKTTTGDIQVSFTRNDSGNTYSVDLDVVDGSQSATLETMAMQVKYRDVEDPDNVAAFGPNGDPCAHGIPYELNGADEFDGEYNCNCKGTLFTGSNCQIPVQVVQCEPGFARIKGECREFKIEINRTGPRKIKDADNVGDFTDPDAKANTTNTYYAIGEPYRIAPFEVLDTSKQSDPTGTLADITYAITGSPELPGGFFLSTTSGEIFFRFAPQDLAPQEDASTYNVTLFAVDKAGARREVETITMDVKYKDVDKPEHGPNGKDCRNNRGIVTGVPTDNEVNFDGNYTCACLPGWDGDNCEEVANNCDDNEIVLFDGTCSACFFDSAPNENQTECIVKACDYLEEASSCVCNVSNLTNAEIGFVNVACNGDPWPAQSADAAQQAPAVGLPRIITQLSFSALEPSRLAGVLEEAARQSDIGSIIIDQSSIADIPLPSSETLSDLNAPADTDASTGRSIALLPECMEVVPESLDIKIGVGSICKAGTYSDLSNDGACAPCERGGFYAATEGRVGFGSHCGCSLCKPGTFSSEPGASDPNEQCQVCPLNTQTDVTAGYRGCACLPDFSRTDRFGPCSSCEGGVGIECTADARVLKKDYFWQFPDKQKEQEYLDFTADLQRSDDYNKSLSQFNGTYPRAYVCPKSGTCLGVTADAASSCVPGNTGPLCAVCEDTYFRLNGACNQCPKSKGGSVVSLIVIALIFILAVWWILRRNAQDVPNVEEWDHTEAAAKAIQNEKTYEVQFMTMVKIVLGYTQIKALLVEVYPGVQWPSSYRSFTGGLQFMSSNPLSIVMPSCLAPSLTITAYSEFVIAAVTPLVLAPIVWIYYMIKTRKNIDKEYAEKLKAICISTACFAYYCLYPTIAVASVRLLSKCHKICQTDDGGDVDGCTNYVEYLRADYSIECGLPRHTGYKVAAGFAFALYSIAVPALIAYLLRHGRRGESKNDASALMAGFSFYSKQYKPEYYFWETVDLYRKLFLTSMVVFIAEGTSMQISFGIIFAVVGLSLQMIYRPYIHTDENRLAAASQVITLLALIVGGLIRATKAEGEAKMDAGNIDGVVMGAYLVTSGVLLYCWALVLVILYRYYNRGSTAMDDGALSAASSKDGKELELVVFANAESAVQQPSEVLYADLDFGSSKKGANQNAKQENNASTVATPAANNSSSDVLYADMDLQPVAVLETNFDSISTPSTAANAETSAENAGYLDVGQRDGKRANDAADEQFDGFAEHAPAADAAVVALAPAPASAAAPAPEVEPAAAKPASFPDGFVVGKRCSVAGVACKGVVRFLGRLVDSDKLRVGVELDEPLGKHNGSPKGSDHAYFVCAKKHGMLVPISKVELEDDAAPGGDETFGGFEDAPAAPAPADDAPVEIEGSTLGGVDL